MTVVFGATLPYGVVIRLDEDDFDLSAIPGGATGTAAIIVHECSRGNGNTYRAQPTRALKRDERPGVCVRR